MLLSGVTATMALEPLVKDMNLLKVSGMEHGVGKSWYWRPMKKVPDNCKLEWSMVGTKESARSLRIDYNAEKGPLARWFQRAVLCGDSGSLTLSGNYRADRGNKIGRIVLNFAVYRPGSRKPVEKLVTALVISGSKPGKWCSFSKKFKIPEGAKSVYVVLEAFPGADIYYDNIRLVQQNIDSETAHYKLKSGKTLVVPKATGKIIVDGKIDDWQCVTFTPLKSAETYDSAMNIVESGTSKSELKGFKGRFACQWTPDHYYICAEITDRKFPYTVNGRNKKYWMTDSVQVAFSPGAERSVKKFGNSDNSIVFMPEAQGTKRELAFETAATSKVAAGKIKFKFCKTPTGYIFEAAVPAELAGGSAQIVPQSATGFNIVINNNDGRGRKWLEWAGGLSHPNWRWLTTSRDPSKFGVAIMAKSRSDYLAGYFLKPKGIITDEQPADLNFVVVSARDIGNITVNAAIKRATGEKYPFTIIMPVKTGVNRKQISLDVPALGDGDFTLEAECQAGDNSFRTSCGMSVVPIAANIKKVIALSNVVKGQLQKLALLLDKCRAKGHDTAVPVASAAVAKVFIDFANYDVFSPDYSKKAVGYLEFCRDLLDKRITQAENVLNGKEKYPVVPHWSMKNISRRDGRLWSGNEPVFLNGYCAGRKIDYPEIFSELGVNVVGFSLSPRFGMLEVDKPAENYYPDTIKPFLDLCRKYNFTSFWLLNHSLKGQLKKSLLKQFPGITWGAGNFCDYDIDHPAVRTLWKNFLKANMPKVADNPYIFAFDLQNEAGWKNASGRTITKFRKWLNGKYAGNVAEMKRNWGKSAPASIAATAGYPANGDKSPGRYFDWCEFNNDRVCEHLAFLKNEISKYLPDRGFSIKIAGEKAFAGSKTLHDKKNERTQLNDGLDREKIARILNMHGCDVRPIAKSCWGSRQYAFAWMGSAMTFDFMKSLAPEQPIMDNEWHAVDTVFYRNRNIDPDHIKGALWHARLHGLSACILWFWGRGDKVVPNPFFFEGSILEQPWLVEAYSQTNLLHKRFVKEISAFAQAPRPLAILYSEASAVHDKKYLDALQQAFEGMNFLGLPLRFVTADQLKNGKVQDIKLIMLPNVRYVRDETLKALDTWRKKGVKILVAGDKSFKYDQWGIPRKTQAFAFEKISCASADDYYNAVEKWLEKSALPREMKALDNAGKPVWGIETRTVKLNGKRYAYVLNLLPDSSEIQLQWNYRDAKPVDLLTGFRVDAKVKIPSRGVLLIQY